MPTLFALKKALIHLQHNKKESIVTTSFHLIARSAAALVGSCFLSATAWAADEAHIRAIVDAAVKPVMAEHDLPGLAVGVTVGGKAYVFNYGMASKEDKRPVTDATLFELGSVSKPYTATLASYAQVLGKLSLEDHPSKYMPELKGTPIDRASLLHLATYTAGGLPQQVPDEVGQGQLVSYLQQWKPDAAPGTVRRYSNPSIGLFGHIAALAMKGDFADLMERQLFPQLGLKNSYIRVPAAAMGDYAWGYDQTNKPARMQGDVLSQQAYGVLASAGDVLRMVQANIDPRRLTPAMRRAVEGTQVGHFAIADTVQGLGWEQYRFPATLDQLVAGNSPAMSMEPRPATRMTAPAAKTQAILFNKTGSTRGFSNYVAFVPQQKIGVVILANKGYPAAARIKAALAILEQVGPARK